jgi:hypothetical protein
VLVPRASLLVFIHRHLLFVRIRPNFECNVQDKEQRRECMSTSLSRGINRRERTERQEAEEGEQEKEEEEEEEEKNPLIREHCACSSAPSSRQKLAKYDRVQYVNVYK